MKLPDEEFISVIRAAPLVSIDLIVRNEAGEILLGKRRNRPAQHYWFVPGGRIKKNEPVQQALQRIGMAELRTAMPAGRLLGVFDHFYQDNYFGVPEVGTHYVVLAYQIALEKSSVFEHDEQHAELTWWPIDALMRSDEVHANTKLYFSGEMENGFRCDCGG